MLSSGKDEDLIHCLKGKMRPIGYYVSKGTEAGSLRREGSAEEPNTGPQRLFEPLYGSANLEPFTHTFMKDSFHFLLKANRERESCILSIYKPTCALLSFHGVSWG